MAYTYEYDRPALTVDAVLFGVDNDNLWVLLIKRADAPYKGRWALPGGFVDPATDDSTDAAIARELEEETGLSGIFLEQLYTFSAKRRDPRERVVSVAHYGLVRPDALTLKAGSDAKEAEWHLMSDLPKLAFDHDKILAMAYQRLQAKLHYQPVGFELLPEKFTLGQIVRLYEVVLRKSIDARNFRRRMLASGVVEPLDEREQGVRHRPGQLYRFNREAYEQQPLRTFLPET